MEYLQPTIGLFGLLLLGAAFSENIKAIRVRYFVFGILLQLGLAILLTKLEIVNELFNFLTEGVMVLKAANDYGTSFVFGYLADGAPNAPFDIDNPAGTFIFAFGGLTLVILMSAISAVLWYWRVIPLLVNSLCLLYTSPSPRD